jgi:hypothetical protein
LAAELTVANRGDNEEAPLLLEQLPCASISSPALESHRTLQWFVQECL